MNDKFSMRRVAMLARFYGPGSRRFLLYTALTVAVAYVLSLLSTMGAPAPGLGLFSLASILVGLPVYVAPIVFARYSDRTLTVGVPATWIEKSVFMLGFCFVAVPAVSAAVWYAGMGIASLFTDHADVTDFMLQYVMQDAKYPGLSSFNISWSRVFNSIAGVLPAIAALYAVLSVKRLPILFGVIAEVATYTVISILSGIYGVVLAFRAGVADGMRGMEPDPEAVVTDILNGLSDMMPYATAVVIMLLIAGAAMVVRKIKNVQV